VVVDPFPRRLSASVPGPPDVDRPSSARVYDFLLGGTSHGAVDRHLGRQMIDAVPLVIPIVRENRSFLRRVVTYLVHAGIDQFLDLGSGIPTVGNVHEVAREVNADARVVYVDLDPVAVGHSKSILGDDPGSYVLQANLLDAAGVVGDEAVRALLDLSRPVCLLMVAVGHFIADDAALGGAISTYRDTLPSGSYIVMSHGTQVKATEESEEIQALYARGGTDTVSRTADELAALLTGWEPIEPGIVFAGEWRPDDPEGAGSRRYNVLAVVARKP